MSTHPNNTLVFDSHAFEQSTLTHAAQSLGLTLTFVPTALSDETVSLAQGYSSICCFVNDSLNAQVLQQLYQYGVRLVAMRCAGYNNVDLDTARALGITLCHVPAYSPHAVAEHAVSLILALNRKIHRAYARVRELNFSLEGLVGFDLYGKTVGVIGTGRIGSVFIEIMRGFGCHVLASDPTPNLEHANQHNYTYTTPNEIFQQSDILSLHAPLTEESMHMIDAEAFEQMKKNLLLINTSRGALIDTPALISALKQHKIAGAGLDVYEQEGNIFFHDLSHSLLSDDVLARLLTFPNVVITSHQGFLTQEALQNIAESVCTDIQCFHEGKAPIHPIP